MLSERFDDALAFAAQPHRQQIRKGTAIPYVSHLLAMCSLVIEHRGTIFDKAMPGALAGQLSDTVRQFAEQ